MQFDEKDYTKLYKLRFEGLNPSKKSSIWKEITNYIESSLFPHSINVLTVVDLGAGDCEFINHISGKHDKYAIDLSDRIKQKATSGVKIFVGSLQSFIDGKGRQNADVVFMSNFLEHLESWREVQAIFRQINGILKPGGRLIILGPNYRYVGNDYWNYCDHILPLNEKTVVEHATWADFKPISIHPKFLPYSFKSRLPFNSTLVKLYLAFPLFWKFFGKQFLLTFEKME